MKMILLAAVCAVALAGCRHFPDIYASAPTVFDDPVVATGADDIGDDAPSYASQNSGGVISSDFASGISILSSALSIAGSVAAINGAGSAARGLSGGALSAGAAGTAARIPAPQGYSQRGAFDDCQRMYAAAGAPHLAAQCAQRATNMNSLR